MSDGGIRTKVGPQTSQTPGQIKGQQTNKAKSLSGGFEMLEKKGINIARPTADQLNDAKKGLKIMLPMESAMEIDMGSVKSTAGGMTDFAAGAKSDDSNDFSDMLSIENLQKGLLKNLGFESGQSVEDLELSMGNNLLASGSAEQRHQDELKLRAAREFNESDAQRQANGTEAKNQVTANNMMSAMSTHLSSPDAQRMLSEVKGQLGTDKALPDNENFSAQAATMSQLMNGGKSIARLIYQMNEKLSLMQDNTVNDRKGMSMAQMAGNMFGRAGGQAVTPAAGAPGGTDKARF